MTCSLNTIDANPVSPAGSATNLGFSPKRLDVTAFYDALQSAIGDAHKITNLLNYAIEESGGMTIADGEMEKHNRLATLLDVCRDIAERITDRTWPEHPHTH